MFSLSIKGREERLPSMFPGRDTCPPKNCPCSCNAAPRRDSKPNRPSMPVIGFPSDTCSPLANASLDSAVRPSAVCQTFLGRRVPTCDLTGCHGVMRERSIEEHLQTCDRKTFASTYSLASGGCETPSLTRPSCMTQLVILSQGRTIKQDRNHKEVN